MTTGNPPSVGGALCRVRAERVAHAIGTLPDGYVRGCTPTRPNTQPRSITSDILLRTKARRTTIPARPFPAGVGARQSGKRLPVAGSRTNDGAMTDSVAQTMPGAVPLASRVLDSMAALTKNLQSVL